MTITERELGMLKRIADNEFGNGDRVTIENPIWIDTLSDSRADNALIGSLVRKGFVAEQKVGPRREWILWITDSGHAALEGE